MKYLLLILSCLSSCFIGAQKDYHFSVMVSYDMYLNFGQREMFKAKLFYSDEAAVFLNKAISNYSCEDVKNEDITEVSFSIQDTTTYIRWSDRTVGETSEKVKISKEYILVTEPLDTIVWEMGDETKHIDSYLCHKAICHYRGRNYTAWFTSDIPCTWGPWKLQGLPGIILEACDDKNEVSFYATGVARKDTTITCPDRQYKTISRKEYLSQLRKTASDMGKRLGSRVGKGFKVSVTSPKIYGIEIIDINND